MPRFGAHLSIAGGVDKAIGRARDVGADCLQIFVKPPQQWRFQKLDDETVDRFRTGAAEADIEPIVGHASYLLNLASPDRDLFAKSRACLVEEWDRAERLGLIGLILHPGSHTGSGERGGLRRIIRALDWLHRRRDHDARILLETTSGAGSTLGATLEQLAFVLQECECRERLGIAIDTCHLFAAGYDLRTEEAVEETLSAIHKAMGLERVAVVHVNDSKGELGANLDRHEHVGRGRIGREGFRALVNHPALAEMPCILETPKKDEDGKRMDPTNLRTLRRLLKT